MLNFRLGGDIKQNNIIKTKSKFRLVQFKNTSSIYRLVKDPELFGFALDLPVLVLE